MTQTLWFVLFTGAAGVLLCLMFIFIRVHNGRPPSPGLTVSVLLLSLACAGSDILRQPPQGVLSLHLLLYAFAMLFVLTDVACRWLPFEFTAPFLLCVLLARGTLLPDTLQEALVSAACMWGVLMSVRTLINHRHARDTFGLGDVWLMTGLAAFFLFTMAAGILLFSLMLMLPAARIHRSPSLPLAPFALGTATLLCVIPHAHYLIRSLMYV